MNEQTRAAKEKLARFEPMDPLLWCHIGIVLAALEASERREAELALTVAEINKVAGEVEKESTEEQPVNVSASWLVQYTGETDFAGIVSEHDKAKDQRIEELAAALEPFAEAFKDYFQSQDGNKRPSDFIDGEIECYQRALMLDPSASLAALKAEVTRKALESLSGCQTVGDFELVMERLRQEVQG